jgi:hypothetical protein
MSNQYSLVETIANVNQLATLNAWLANIDNWRLNHDFVAQNYLQCGLIRIALQCGLLTEDDSCLRPGVGVITMSVVVVASQ